MKDEKEGFPFHPSSFLIHPLPVWAILRAERLIQMKDSQAASEFVPMTDDLRKRLHAE
jgi:hypothetical protein